MLIDLEYKMKTEKIICWWSGGITSAVSCYLSIELFGIENCEFIMIDTMNEDLDTYRFKADCEKWYRKKIEVIKSDKYSSIQDVWLKNKSLNVAKGAVCSSSLKKEVREKWQKNNTWKHQVFGFDTDEINRAKGLKLNHPKTSPIFPLLFFGLKKKDCIAIIEQQGIEIPNMYKLGFKNNNCFQTGCVQGGIGYWQKMKAEFPLKFEAMADMEHKLTELKGVPVTMLKDQGNAAKESGNRLVFLNRNDKYPSIKTIDDFKKQIVEPLADCNGLCGVNDLEIRSSTEKEINYQTEIEW